MARARRVNVLRAQLLLHTVKIRAIHAFFLSQTYFDGNVSVSRSLYSALYISTSIE